MGVIDRLSAGSHQPSKAANLAQWSHQTRPRGHGVPALPRRGSSVILVVFLTIILALATIGLRPTTEEISSRMGDFPYGP